MSRSTYQKLFLIFALLTLAQLMVACTSGWVGEAQSILSLLGPAITSALAILTVFGVGLSPNALTQIQNWEADAQASLKTAGEFIDQYNAAEASAKPGILESIQSALNVALSNLNQILPELQITDKKTQGEIVAVFEAIIAEVDSLINLVPALQGKVSTHEFKALVSKVKSPQEFKLDYNMAVSPFGEQYKI